jgi:hypothetical protein
MTAVSPTTLRFINGATGEPLPMHQRRLILAGYTGRDRASVQKHIDELAAQGVAPPEQVPALYTGEPGSIQIDGSLPAVAGWASGEVEFVLLVGDGGVFVGVGSDHTDRDLERTSVVASKRAFSKIVSRILWPVEALQAEWDQLCLQSWVTHDSEHYLYQQGTLATMMTPTDLLNLLPSEDRAAGLVLFSGTVPAAAPAPASGACHFDGVLLAADGRALAACGYDYVAR